jgi:diguanylate cyclase (GGDEF)-like protein/PAS domain S-box-containing protein
MSTAAAADGDGRAGAVSRPAHPIGDSGDFSPAPRLGEARFRSILLYAADLVDVRDADGTVRYISPSVTQLLGYAPEDLVDVPPLSLVHPDDQATFGDTAKRLGARAGGWEDVHYRVRHRDGSWRWFQSRIANLLEDPAVGAIVTCSWDETERWRVLERGARSQEALRAIVESSPLGIFAVAPDGATQIWNRACERIFGWTADEVLGHPLPFPTTSDPDRLAEARRRYAAGETVEGSEMRARCKDGREVDVSISSAPVRRKDGRVTTVMGVVADITGQKEAERALRESEEGFRALVEYSSDIISVLEPDGAWRTSSAGGTRLLGWPKGFEPAGGIFSLLHPDDLDAGMAAYQELAEGRRGPEDPIVLRIQATDGSYRYLETTGQDLRDHPAIRGLVLNSRDVTERVEAERALRESEERFRALVQSSSDIIAVLDADARLVYASPAAESILGYPDGSMIGRNVFELLHPDDLRPAQGAMAETLLEPGDERQLELRLAHADGSWRHLEVVGRNLLTDPAVKGIVLNAREITERRQAEEALRRSEERYRGIVEDQTELICRYQADGTLTFVNEACARYFESTVDELVGANWRALLPEETRDQVEAQLRELGPGSPFVTLEQPVEMADGSTRWQQWTDRVVFDEGGEVVEYQAVGRDITEKRTAEALVAEQARILEMIARGAPLEQVLAHACLVVESHVPEARCSVLLSDDDGLGLHLGAAPSLPDGFLPGLVDGICIGPANGCCGTAAYRGEPVISADISTDPLWDGCRDLALSHGLRACWSTPIVSQTDKGLLGTFAVYYDEPRRPPPDHERLVDLMVHLATIAIERKQYEARLAHQANHDPLTGLTNRMLFLEILVRALARSRRSRTRVAVLFLDVDRFKLVNDSLGHDAGDELLVALGRRLDAGVRPGDAVARFGGDEFVVLCEELSGHNARQQAIEVAERLLALIRQPFVLDGEEHFLSASIGVAVVRRGDEQPDELLRDADSAMYRAKERGKGRWELFDEAMRARALRQLETEDALHGAVDRGEFRLFYQPVVSLSEGRCIGAEALLRWQRPDQGLLVPSEFVHLAEENGLIVPIGAWVLDQACRAAARWRAAAGERPFTVSVNLSERQLSHPDTPGQVAAAIERSGIEPGSLTLEVTESVLMDDAESTLTGVAALKALGVSLSIDDFGTGYSSLGYLRRLPVDSLKVDRSFVSGLGRDAEDSAVVAAAVSLGHALGLTVVAEGVEDQAQLDALVALGCDAAQGFLFARPEADNDGVLPGAQLLGVTVNEGSRYSTSL